MARYEISTEVGQGGFGKVRKGMDTELDRPIALKTLDPLWAEANDSDKERFRREAKILAKLTHPNIPAIYDIAQTESQFHIIFQFIEGKTLRAVMAEGRPALADVRTWFDQVASALEHAHTFGIIHRDIKPENMIITHDRHHCYLVDFGLAVSKSDRERLTPSDCRVGTPGYMSPEQENGQELDSSDDVYVLAICLYEALSGHRIGAGEYEDLNLADETIPPALDDMIRNCIAPKKQRVKSAGEFRLKLSQSFQTHLPLSKVLSEGQLHEVVEAISSMTPTEFLLLPPGQRLLILSKCKDVVASTEHRLQRARSDFLRVLITLAINIQPEHYRFIIENSLSPAFEAQVGPTWIGNREIRDALAEAAAQLAQPNHHVMVDALLVWMGSINIKDKENWFYHTLRVLIQRLLANMHCTEGDAINLEKQLGLINALQRDHTSGMF